MQGVFDITKFDAKGFCDADFDHARRAGKLDQILSKLPVLQKAKAVNNMLFDNMAAYFFYNLFSGPDIANPFDYATTTAAAFGTILLMTSDGEPTYTEATSENNKTPHNLSGSVNTSSAGKRFIEDFIVAYNQATSIVTDPGFLGREAIKFTGKWMYYPSQASSTNIRSIGIYYSWDADSTSGGYEYTRGRIGRVRLKDQNGRNIIIHKNTLEVLLVEYSFLFVSS